MLRTGLPSHRLHLLGRQSKASGSSPAPPASSRDIFDFWQADGELGEYPPYNVATGGFDYWQADNEFPAIECETT